MNKNRELTNKIELSKEKLRKIYHRIPFKELRERPEIEKVIFPEPRIIFQIISKFEKSEEIKIPKGLEEPKLKRLKSLNEFSRNMLRFNKDEITDIKNQKLKEQTRKFLKNYDNLLKDKNKYNTGSYVDHEYLVDIANQYNKKGMKIPKLSQDANIFKSNPLLLTGSELENYFLYNYGNRYKSTKFLKRIDNITERKLQGNYILSAEEEDHLEYLIQKEKEKGLIPFNKLIPQLKKDILKTQDTINDMPKVFINYGQNIISSHSRNKNENTQDYSTNITNNSNKRRANSFISFNKLSFRINSGISTKVAKKRFSLIENKINFPEIEFESKSNVTSALSRKKTNKNKSFKIEKNNMLSYLKQKLFKNNKFRSILSGYTKNNNTSISESENNNIYINDKNNVNKVHFNLKKKRLLKSGNKSLLSLNSAKTKSLNSALSKSSNLINEEYNTNKNNTSIINNELPLTNIENNSNIELKSNIFKIYEKEKQKEREKEKEKTLEERKREELKEQRYNKCESIFNLLVKGNYKSRRCKSVMNDYLKMRGYDPLRKFNVRDNVLNINRMKNRAVERNFIKEEYQLRNSDNGKAPLSDEQEKIIKKNDKIINQMEDNDYILKKIIIEKKIDKDKFQP